jgi:hypothetical protein
MCDSLSSTGYPLLIGATVPLTDEQAATLANPLTYLFLQTHPQAAPLLEVQLVFALDGGLLVLFLDEDREIFAAMHQAHGMVDFRSVCSLTEIDGLRGLTQ